jgi:hypothetical protein
LKDYKKKNKGIELAILSLIKSLEWALWLYFPLYNLSFLLLFSLIYHTVSSSLPNHCYYTAKNLQDDIFQQLNTLDKIDGKVELFEKLMNDLKLIKTSKQIIPYLDWLKNKILERNETFRYLTLYSLYHVLHCIVKQRFYYK